MKKIREILLVDDSPGTNSLNKRLLEEMGICESVSVALNGKIALDYLTQLNENGELPNPEIIFLDIRMPVMDGFQFLEKYHEMDLTSGKTRVIIMLTTSSMDEDIERVKKYNSVKGYQFKPLIKEDVLRIIENL